MIIITTKHGSKDHLTINYSGYTGFQTPVDIMKMANAQEYIQLLNEKGVIQAKKTGGTFTPYNPANYPTSTDWFSEILRKKANVHNNEVSFSGGNEKAQFSLGVGNLYQEGSMQFSSYERTTVRATIDSQIKDWLKIGINANLSSAYSNKEPSES